MSTKRSFFERLTGAVKMEDEAESPMRSVTPNGRVISDKGDASWIEEETDKDAELTVDVYQSPEMVIVKSMIAGVRPDDLDVSITRDQVTIRGRREEERMTDNGDYLVRELYWGAFSRTVSLPEEIDVDSAEAVEKHGLLILKLPKLDKKRQSKLKVRTA